MKRNPSRRHAIIPDGQLRPGDDLTHVKWAARALVEYKPDVVIVIGDWGDFPSLLMHDAPGSKQTEGRRVQPDIDIFNEGFELLTGPMRAEQARRRKNRRVHWNPECHFLFGNHEDRLTRAVNLDPKWEGILSLDALLTPGFKRHDYLKIVEIDGIKYCMNSRHRVLTADLRYAPLRDLKVGDKLLGFDEFAPLPRSRAYKTSVVEALDFTTAPLFRVTLESGKSFDVTADHQWLVRRYLSTEYIWQQTSELVAGRDHALRLFDEWDEVHSKEAGWIAGILDGEGCLTKPNSKQGGLQLVVAQNDGSVLRRLKESLSDHGFKYLEYTYRKCHSLKINGPSCHKLKLLGQTRPARLLENFKPEMMGRVQAPDHMGNDTVVSVDAIGEGEIALIKTSTGTMIAEGYAHHNCHFFPNPHSGRPIGGTITNRLGHIGSSFVQGHQQGFQYASKQYPDHVKHGLVCGRFYQHHETYRAEDVQLSEWNGIVILNGVRNGDYDLMPLRMDYLQEKYG